MGASKIISIKTTVIDIPYKKTWEISLAKVTSKAHIFVQVITEDGIKGYGEASPAPSFMGESGYTIAAVITNHIKNVLVGEDIFNISRIHHIMDRQISHNTAAKAAIDIAIHDAVGKSMKMPVYKLLGGRFRDEIQLAWSVGLQSIDASVEEAMLKFNEGYKEIKVKVGTDINKDIKLLKQLRKLLGPDIPMRIDANQGFSPADAVLLMKSIGCGVIGTFEQPVSKWNINGLKYVKEHADGVKIMADESVSCLTNCKDILSLNAADSFNIKVGKVGGLYRACQIAAVAEAAGLKACAGSNTELGIGEAASLHFVTSQPALSLPNDMMAGSELHSKEFILNPFNLKNGKIKCTEEAGLGVKVDESIFK